MLQRLAGDDIIVLQTEQEPQLTQKLMGWEPLLL
jgi:hypothetical protein